MKSQSTKVLVQYQQASIHIIKQASSLDTEASAMSADLVRSFAYAETHLAEILWCLCCWAGWLSKAL